MSTPFSDIADCYATYKTGTRQLVRWLAVTADSCSDKIPGLSNGAHTVTVSKLAELADSITTGHDSLDIPASILELFREVISQRQYCADWYAAESIDNEKESNESHQHFVDALQQVHDKLKTTRDRHVTRQRQRNGDAASVPEDEEAATDLGNAFVRLQLEVPSAIPLGSTPEKKATVGKTKQTRKHQAEDENERFAVWCFLKDLRDLRNFIRGIWQVHADGYLSLMVAAVVTDWALSMMRAANDKLEESFDDFGDYAKMLEHLGLTSAADVDEPRFTMRKGNEQAETDSDLLCPVAGSLMMSLMYECKLYDQSTTNEGAVSKMRTQCSGFVPQHISEYPFLLILVGLMPDLHHLSFVLSEPEHVCDEFTIECTTLFKAERLAPWLVSACQAYLVITEVMGGWHPLNPEEAYSDYLKRSGSAVFMKDAAE